MNLTELLLGSTVIWILVTPVLYYCTGRVWLPESWYASFLGLFMLNLVCAIAYKLVTRFKQFVTHAKRD